MAREVCTIEVMAGAADETFGIAKSGSLTVPNGVGCD